MLNLDLRHSSFVNNYQLKGEKGSSLDIMAHHIIMCVQHPLGLILMRLKNYWKVHNYWLFLAQNFILSHFRIRQVFFNHYFLNDFLVFLRVYFLKSYLEWCSFYLHLKVNAQEPLRKAWLVPSHVLRYYFVKRKLQDIVTNIDLEGKAMRN